MTTKSAAAARLDASEALPAIAVLTPRALLAVFVPAIVLLNVANAIAVFLYHHRHHHGGRFFQEFSLDHEANVPSWFSSALLLTAAALLALVALDALASKARWGRHWAGLSVVFVVLSLDETAEIHERIGSWLRAHLHLHGPLHYAGVIPALALALFVGITYVRFLRALPRATLLGILVAAAIYITGAAGVEAASGWWAEGHGSGSTALLLVSTVEENLEMVGTLFFILVVLAYFARLGRSVALRAER
jgi:amino acid transporter